MFSGRGWRWVWRGGLAICLILMLAVGGFVAWALNVPDIMPEAEAALQADRQVAVTEGDWLEFMPLEAAPTVGYVLYPGGRVPAKAYAPLARAIAQKGYFVAIVNAPLNLAFFDTQAAAPVIAAHPAIKTWAVGGHSLGGVAASAFARDNARLVQGLVLMASIPVPGAELEQRTDLQVVSIFGTLDGLNSVEQVAASQAELPAATTLVAIEGGNHAQFGYYGDQSGDHPAAIGYADQQAQIVAATITLLAQLHNP